MKKKYITIAKSLGIVLPACLLATSVEASATTIKDVANEEISIQQNVNQTNSHLMSNPVKARIVQSYNSETIISPYQIDHTNIHANYRIDHTNVHTDFRIDGSHTDQHSNTRAHHVDSHSNSPV